MPRMRAEPYLNYAEYQTFQPNRYHVLHIACPFVNIQILFRVVVQGMKELAVFPQYCSEQHRRLIICKFKTKRLCL